jgi:hypothetical protein
MRKEIRRIVMFCTILTVGLLLLFIDVTFIQLLLLVVAIAVILPFLLGLVTIAEIRTAADTFKEQKLKKISILKKLDDIKLFEKKAPQKSPAPTAKSPAKPEVTPQKAPVAGKSGSGSKFPFSSQIDSIVSSMRSLITVIQVRSKSERKETDINRMLDKTVSEKVEKGTAPVAAAQPGNSALPAPGGGASGDEDPFLSLSGDDFDTGLLDGLDDMDTGSPVAMPSPETDLTQPVMPEGPSSELDDAAMDILKAHGADEGLEELGSLETGGGVSDTDFGELDNLSLDDMDLDAELDGEEISGGSEAPAAPPSASNGADVPRPPGDASSPAVKTAWIPSDAPKGADQEDSIGTQSDMASFAGGATGTDEDLLSSISSDVKRSVKEKDTSLLRELKDFKAPADEIEKELNDMYQRMNIVQKPKETTPPATNGVK